MYCLSVFKHIDMLQFLPLFDNPIEEVKNEVTHKKLEGNTLALNYR